MARLCMSGMPLSASVPMWCRRVSPLSFLGWFRGLMLIAMGKLAIFILMPEHGPCRPAHPVLAMVFGGLKPRGRAERSDEPPAVLLAELLQEGLVMVITQPPGPGCAVLPGCVSEAVRPITSVRSFAIWSSALFVMQLNFLCLLTSSACPRLGAA